MKRIALLLPLLCLPCFAQVAVIPVNNPHVTFVDASGVPCSGCKFYSYAAGTTTPLATYTDASGTSTNTNPITLDTAGGANIWMGGNSYKFTLKDASGTTIWTVDQIKGAGGISIIANPSDDQTITQPINTDFNVVTSGNGALKHNGLSVLDTSTGVLLNPTTTQSIAQPSGTFDKHNALSADGNFLTSNAGAQTIRAWGNSQTQGYGLSGCNTLTCHPATAWPAVFASKMGWTLDNQAYGSSSCADLSYQGTSESMWDPALAITTSSRSIYGHFRNDQSQYGYSNGPYGPDVTRGCIEAQIAWLAIPEANKVRASGAGCTKTGTWVDGNPNAATSSTVTNGATMTCNVNGKTVYVAAASVFSSGATYSITVDGTPIYNPASGNYVFTQQLPSTQDPGFPTNENIAPYLIRVPGIVNGPHTVVYTCVNANSKSCLVFYMAGLNTDNATSDGPFVYSMSPVYNAPSQQTGNLTPLTTSLYYDEWRRIISELDSDGLQVIGLDVTNPAVYNSSDPSQVQADGVHPSILGASNIAAAAVSKATSASTPSAKAESKAPNAVAAYDGFGAGRAPSTAGAGYTTSGIYLPKGMLWSSTGPQSGQVFFGFDGKTSLGRLADDPSNTNELGTGHIYVINALDSQNTNFAASGQLTSSISSVNNGGTVRAKNGTGTSDDIMQGSNGNGLPDWPNNAVLTTNTNRVINADAGSIFFQSNRVTKMVLSATGLVLNIPITIGSATVPTVTTPTVGHASCIKAAGPPIVIGYCSTVVDSAGACTCN